MTGDHQFCNYLALPGTVCNKCGQYVPTQDPAADPRLVREFKLEAELAASQERVRELEGEFEQFKIDGGKAIQFNRERAEKAEQERDALANALARLHLDTRMLLAGKPVRDIDEALIEAQCALDAMKPVSSEMDSPNK